MRSVFGLVSCVDFPDHVENILTTLVLEVKAHMLLQIEVSWHVTLTFLFLGADFNVFVGED